MPYVKDLTPCYLHGETLKQVLEYITGELRISTDILFLAGSFPVAIYHSPIQEIKYSDIDIFVRGTRDQLERFLRTGRRLNGEWSKHAFNTYNHKLRRKIQLIPIGNKTNEEVLNSFDLTSAEVGISFDRNLIPKMIAHTDHKTKELGICGMFDIKNPDISSVVRAIKYSKKFLLPEIDVFKNYTEALEIIEPKFDGMPIDKIVEHLTELSEMNISSYEENELIEIVSNLESPVSTEGFEGFDDSSFAAFMGGRQSGRSSAPPRPRPVRRPSRPEGSRPQNPWADTMMSVDTTRPVATSAWIDDLL